ncbi:MAG: acyl-CoA thioesterase [Spirochaetes bacterium]|nr:acyl-CoA thioesterase [Spirochaetota bacterium]
MYSYPVNVEFEDVDTYGIAHHTKIIAYLERARVHFIADNNIDLNSLSYGIVLTNMNIKFKLPLLMLEKINIELRVKKIDKFKFEWDYIIKKEGKVVIRANIEQVVIDIATKKIIIIPSEMRKVLETILIET